MIISQIFAGLGNQMFQYAAGRALSLYHKTVMKMDLEAYNNDSFRSFQLNHFNIKCLRASTKEIKSLQSPSILRRAISYLPFFDKTVIMKENGFAFNSNFFTDSTSNTYIFGHWQSERYFENYSREIREEFQIISPISKEADIFLKRIKNTDNPVSLHIRRTDFITDKTYIGYTLPASYYRRAIEIVSSKLNNPTFFIFSDDITWVKQNFYLEQNHFFIECTSNIDDLFLMQSCHHHIIANSTFSWWGAWLNPSNDKIIIAPKLWFKPDAYWNNGQKVDTKDIIPKKWIQI